MTKPVKLIAALMVVLAVVCCILVLRPGQEGSTLRITRNGQVLREIDLNKVDKPEVIYVPSETECTNLIRVEPGRVRVEQADCPDQICVNQGWISDSTVPIVCLPNKVIVEILGEEGMFDAAAK